MKKNTKKIVTLLLFSVVAVGTYFVSGTYAKYTTSLTGSDTATVAKWAWDYKGTALTKNDSTITFDLFDTIVDTVDGNTDNEVATGKIAPGTKGSFAFDFQNKSEVDATYNLTLTATVTFTQID